MNVLTRTFVVVGVLFISIYFSVKWLIVAFVDSLFYLINVLMSLVVYIGIFYIFYMAYFHISRVA